MKIPVLILCCLLSFLLESCGPQGVIRVSKNRNEPPGGDTSGDISCEFEFSKIFATNPGEILLKDMKASSFSYLRSELLITVAADGTKYHFVDIASDPEKRPGVSNCLAEKKKAAQAPSFSFSMAIPKSFDISEDKALIYGQERKFIFRVSDSGSQNIVIDSGTDGKLNTESKFEEKTSQEKFAFKLMKGEGGHYRLVVTGELKDRNNKVLQFKFASQYRPKD